jgi:hypothetical protein
MFYKITSHVELKMKFSFADFPLDILTYINSTKLLKAKEWRLFMNCTKLWKGIRKNSVILHLNEKYSLKYYSNEKTREKIRKAVESPSSQLFLTYTYRPSIEDLSVFQRIAGIRFINCFSLRNHSFLSSLSVVKLQHCDTVDVSMLSNIETLDLSGNSRLINISSLHSVKYLTLANCCSVKDVSSLGVGNYYLDLSDCQRITKVNHLGKVHTLILKNLRKLTDVSGLGNVHRLDLSSCVKLRGLSALQNIPFLKLSDCRFLDDHLVVLGNNHVYLDLSYCHKITDLSSVKAVDNLNIRGCKLISKISMLNCKKLDIYKCPLLKDYDVSLLKNVKRIYQKKEPKLEYKFEDPL